MSQGHHHRHNNSLRRALLAQAGPQAYPYMKYSPTVFTPRQVGYDGVFNQGYGRSRSFNGYGAPYGGFWSSLGKGLKGVGGALKEVLPAAAGAGGAIFSQHMENKSAESIAQANADAQAEIAQINADANTKMAEMQFKFGNTSVGIWTIVGIVGGVAVLGGLTFFVLRKRRK